VHPLRHSVKVYALTIMRNIEGVVVYRTLLSFDAPLGVAMMVNAAEMAKTVHLDVHGRAWAVDGDLGHRCTTVGELFRDLEVNMAEGRAAKFREEFVAAHQQFVDRDDGFFLQKVTPSSTVLPFPQKIQTRMWLTVKYLG
jgi:hypothetical protein